MLRGRAEALHLVERRGICGLVSAGGGAGRNWSPLSSTNGRDLPPGAEDGRREVRRRGHGSCPGSFPGRRAAARRSSRRRADRRGAARATCSPTRTPASFAGPSGTWGSSAAYVGVERALLSGIEADERAVRGGVGGRGLGCVARRAHADQVGLVRAVDRVDRVVDRGVQDREAPGRLDVRGLCARRVHDREQGLVPVDHRLPGLAGLPSCADMTLPAQGRMPGRGRRRSCEHEGNGGDHESLHRIGLLCRINYYDYADTSRPSPRSRRSCSPDRI